MKKNEILQKYLYILEEKLSSNAKEWYQKHYTNLKKRKEISNGKCRDLVIRINQGWVISDALSYSEDLNTIINAYKEIIKSSPWKRYRIVRAKCLFHVDYGISTSDIDYRRIEILPMRKHDVCLRIKNICSFIFNTASY